MKAAHWYVALVTALVMLTGAMWGCRATTAHIRKKPPPFFYDDRQAITVVSFNIRVGYGVEDWGTNPYKLKDHQKDLDPIVAAIRSCDADIVGLQEVLGSDQATKLARRLNMNVAYAGHPTYSPSGPWWGVAILSKYPILRSQGFAISSGAGNSKSALLCTIDVGGREQHYLSIHKDKDLKDGGSFKKIMGKIEAIKGPMVLIGDLNMSPFDPRLNLLKPRFRDSAEKIDSTTAQEARSVGTFYGIGRIDFVMIDPADAVERPHAARLLGRGAVDLFRAVPETWFQ